MKYALTSKIVTKLMGTQIKGAHRIPYEINIDYGMLWGLLLVFLSLIERSFWVRSQKIKSL